MTINFLLLCGIFTSGLEFKGFLMWLMRLGSDVEIIIDDKSGLLYLI